MSTAAKQGEVKNITIEPAIPLTAPDGRLFGYACPRCQHFRCGIEGGTLQDRVQYSLEYASRCCLCPRCGTPKKKGNWALNRCKPCDAIERAEWAARLEDTRPEREASQARLDAALARSKDENAALVLMRLMSDLSEEHYCAGWMLGLEFSLWKMVQGGERYYGMAEVSESEVAQLKQLSDQAGGWWYFNEADGETFITLDEWQQKYVAIPRA